MQPLSLVVTPQMVFWCHLMNLYCSLIAAALSWTFKKDAAALSSQVHGDKLV